MPKTRFSKQAAAVTFNWPGRADVVVPLANAPEYAVAHPGEWVSEVIWEDGSRSFGKCWRSTKQWPQLARIGAGAYGDCTIWVAANG
jgi:hypothetical protein